MVNTGKEVWIKREADREKVLPSAVSRFRRALTMQVLPLVEFAKDRTLYAMDEAINAFVTTDSIQQAYIQVYRDVGFEFAVLEFNRMKNRKSEPENFRSNWFEYFDNWVRAYGGDMIRGVTDTTKQIVRAILMDANQQGLSAFETANYLTDNYEPYSFFRAERIARTEVITASNLGTYQGALATGLSLKKVWIATQDQRTRDTHLILDGTQTTMEGSFFVGASEARYPGDPALSAKERINCRCTIDFIEI